MQLFDYSFFSVIFKKKNTLYHSKAINKLLFINDSSFYSGSRDSIIKLWGIENKNDNDTNFLHLLSNYDNHYNWITDLSLIIQKKFLFSASNDQSICQWDTSTHSLIKKFPQVHKDYITACQYNNTKEYLYSSGLDGMLYEINIDKGKATSWICNTNSQSIYSFDTSNDGNIFLVSYYNNNLVLYDGRVKQNEVIKQFKGHNDIIKKVRLSLNLTKAVSISNDTTVRIWDIAQGTELHRFTFHQSPVMSLYVNEDFTRIITGSKEGEIYLIDVNQSIYTKVDQLTESIQSIAMNPSESKLLISSGSSLYHYQLRKKNSKEKNDKNNNSALGSIELSSNINKIRQSTVIVKDEMIECSILKNKIYAISKYKDNSVALYNLLKLKKIYCGTKFAYEELKDKLNKMISVNKLNPWCSIDIKLGCLTMEITEKSALSNNKIAIDFDIDIIEKYIEKNFNDAQVDLNLIILDIVKNTKDVIFSNQTKVKENNKGKDKGKDKAKDKGKENIKEKEKKLKAQQSIVEIDEPTCCSIIFDYIVLSYLSQYFHTTLSIFFSIGNIESIANEYLLKYFQKNTNIDSIIKAIQLNNTEYQIAFFDYNSTSNNSIQQLFLSKDIECKDLIEFPKFIYNKATYSLLKDLYLTNSNSKLKTKMRIIINKTSFKVLDKDKDREKIEDFELSNTCTLSKLFTFLIKNLDKNCFQEYIFNEIKESNLNENQKKYIEDIYLNDNSIFIELTLDNIPLRPCNVTLKTVEALLSKVKNMTIHMKHVSIDELIKRGIITFGD